MSEFSKLLVRHGIDPQPWMHLFTALEGIEIPQAVAIGNIREPAIFVAQSLMLRFAFAPRPGLLGRLTGRAGFRDFEWSDVEGASIGYVSRSKIEVRVSTGSYGDLTIICPKATQPVADEFVACVNQQVADLAASERASIIAEGIRMERLE